MNARYVDNYAIGCWMQRINKLPVSTTDGWVYNRELNQVECYVPDGRCLHKIPVSMLLQVQDFEINFDRLAYDLEFIHKVI